VDRRLIGRKFSGNFGFLPGFGRATILAYINSVALYRFRTDRTEIPVVLLRHEYRAVDKSRDFQLVLLECDVMRLRGSVFTEP
jgi:hypothetical protein